MKRTLFIGIDAAEPVLIKNWLEDGSMPNLQKLAAAGQTRLVSYPNDVVIHPWSNFYTGKNPGAHGVYNYICWDPESMRSHRFSLKNRGLEPFWREFGQNGPKVIAVDMPMLHKSEGSPALEVHGWATHEIQEPYFTIPPELKQEIQREAGPHQEVWERYGLHTTPEILQVREEMIRMIDQTTTLIEYLLKNKSWDLFLAAYHSLHLGGHKFWALTGLESDPAPDAARLIESTLKDLFVLFDASLGKILALIPEDTTVLIGSFHGMGASTSRVPILPDLVARIAAAERGAHKPGTQKPGLLASLRQMVPLPLRHYLKTRMPIKLQDQLTTFWRQGGIKWDQTPVFAQVSDFDGYIRINLKGREKQGIVSPGAEYEFWVDKVTKGLHSFTDRDSGTPLVERVIRREELDLTGPYADLFPDLFVQWSETPCAQHRAVSSPLYGEIPWPTPGKNPDGRSGNHLRKGILIANGGDFPTSSKELGEITVQDVTATIYRLAGQTPPDEVIGKPIY